jgi:serine/threonine protein kinase
MEPATLAFIALQVARGLAYAHGLTAPSGQPLDIVHRDVTPSNIMVLRSGAVKLLDFGIAKTQAAFTVGENTETGVCKGKLPYLAPEQVEGHPLDRRTDIFTLGVVMWEALTGKRLFLGRSDYETMQNVLQRPVPPPSELRPGIPAALDELVLCALERNPEHRFPDARALGDALESVVQDLRYRSDAVPRLLDDLFGREDNSVSLTPADLPCIDAGPAGTWPSYPSTRRTLTRRDPDATPGTGATAFRRRRRRWAAVATATLVSLLCLLLGGRWLDNHSEARAQGATAVQLAAGHPR